MVQSQFDCILITQKSCINTKKLRLYRKYSSRSVLFMKSQAVITGKAPFLDYQDKWNSDNYIQSLPLKVFSIKDFYGTVILQTDTHCSQDQMLRSSPACTVSSFRVGNNQMENLCTFIHYHFLEGLHQIIQSKMLCSYANKEPFTMYYPSFYSGVFVKQFCRVCSVL